MPTSSIEREVDRFHIRLLTSIYVMYDKGEITKDQRDKFTDLIEHMDEYSQAEFEQAWNEIVELGKATG